MLQVTNLSNVYRKRTLRPLYQQSAIPFAATLDSSFDRTAGQLSGSNAITNSKAAINAGSVAVKLAGSNVTLANASVGGGTPATLRPFGLFGNNVGGQLDELGTSTEVAVWYGPGTLFEILAPAFDSTGLSSAATGENGTHGTEVWLEAGSKGQLQLAPADSNSPAGTSHRAAARLIEYLSANAIVVELLV